MAEEKTGRDPFGDRYNTSETEDTQETDDTEDTSKTEKTPVRERKNINMYIEDDELVERFELRYSELNVEWKKMHGEDMPKNDVWYPAVLKAVLEGRDVKDVLGL